MFLSLNVLVAQTSSRLLNRLLNNPDERWSH
jgi:hypothetical protein